MMHNIPSDFDIRREAMWAMLYATVGQGKPASREANDRLLRRFEDYLRGTNDHAC